jgi:multidrug efflux pump subunit AcrA (membrane-fusion protein)
MATGNYELVATVPLEDLNYIKVGNTVSLHSEDIAGKWTGRIKRISDQIDPASQTVQVFVGVSGQGLREGMYLRGEVAAKAVADAYRMERALLVNQNQVYELQDSTLRLREVEVVKMEPEHVIIRGLPDGLMLLHEKVPGVYDGMKVAPKTAKS